MALSLREGQGVQITITHNADRVYRDLGVSAGDLREIMGLSLIESAESARDDFLQPTATWSRRPPVEIEQERMGIGGKIGFALGMVARRLGLGASRSTTMAIKVFVDDLIYWWLDQGTKRHWVEPVKAPYMVFQAGRKAKTQPDSLIASPGGPFGPVVKSTGHWVSGIPPRRFSDIVDKRAKKKTPRIFNRRLREWTNRNSGV